MADRIQHRRDTKARWAEYNPILLEGEVGYVSDNPNQYKIGDGEHHWNDLPLRGFDGNIVQGTGDDEEAVMSQKATTEKLNALDEKISKETTDRGTAITTAINKEVSDRNTAIKTAIDKEVVDRNNAIAVETKSRQEADNALKKEVDDIKEDMGQRGFLRGGEYMQVAENDITLEAFCPDGTSRLFTYRQV